MGRSEARRSPVPESLYFDLFFSVSVLHNTFKLGGMLQCIRELGKTWALEAMQGEGLVLCEAEMRVFARVARWAQQAEEEKRAAQSKHNTPITL